MMYMGLKSICDGLQDANTQLLESLTPLWWNQDQEIAKVNFALALVQCKVQKNNGQIDAIQGAPQHGSQSPTHSVAAVAALTPLV